MSKGDTVIESLRENIEHIRSLAPALATLGPIEVRLPLSQAEAVLDVVEAARALRDAEHEYRAAVDAPRPDPLPDLDDPAVAREWFGPFDRMQEARLLFQDALARLDAAQSGKPQEDR